MKTRAQAIKEKKWIIWTSKLKMFFLQKTLLRQSKDKTEWKKIFSNHMSDKGLVSQIDKELLKANSKELN